MVDYILCYLGFHPYELFVMDIDFQKAFPEMAHIGRKCVVCDNLQYLSNNKKVWQDGVRGVLVKHIVVK